MLCGWVKTIAADSARLCLTKTLTKHWQSTQHSQDKKSETEHTHVGKRHMRADVIYTKAIALGAKEQKQAIGSETIAPY